MDDYPFTRRYWPSAVVLGLLLGLAWNRRAGRDASNTGRELGQDLGNVVVDRWAKTDKDSRAMLDLTRQMVRLTWAVMTLTIVVLGVTLYAGLR
jgi:hypothetical protein